VVNFSGIASAVAINSQGDEVIAIATFRSIISPHFARWRNFNEETVLVTSIRFKPINAKEIITRSDSMEKLLRYLNKKSYILISQHKKTTWQSSSNESRLVNAAYLDKAEIPRLNHERV